MALKFNPIKGEFDICDVNDVYIGSGGYSANLYFTTIDSTVSGYKQIQYTAEATETELTIPCTTTEILARTYLYDGALETTSIDAGRWVSTYRAKVSSTKGVTIRFEAFLRHTDTTETTLFSSSSDVISNTTYDTLKDETTQPIFSCVATDRLGVRIYASTTHPAGVTLNTIVGDGDGSYFTTPLSIRHSQLRDKNGEADVQHLTAAEKAKATDNYLKLDQATTQTVDNGMPIFNGGLKVNGGSPQYFINLSPVVHSSTNYYIPGDAAVVFYFSPTADVQLVFDDGNPKLPINISGMSVTQPTIYMYLITTPALDNAHVTCFSDLETVDFLAFIKGLTEDPDAVIDYSETAFTFADGVYTNVTTKPVCPTSAGGTTWTDPSAITSDYAGFTVNPTTTNIDHVANYTNVNTNSIFKTKGQIKAGNGNLIDLVTCPITSNPILDLSGGGLQFAMTCIPEIISTGTVDTPISRSVYASGVYGATAFEGGYATYGGTAFGLWATVQNTINGPTTLQEGIGIRAGMTYSSNTNQEMYVRDMICFQTDFTNLNNGTSKHDNIKHYEAKLLSSNVNSCTNNYAFYTADNSAKATNSWGLYSLEPSNYAKKLYLGATPTKPTKELEVTGNASIVGDGTGIENAPLVVKQTTAYASPYNQYIQLWKSSDGTNVGHFRADGSMTVGNSKANAYQARINGNETIPVFMSNDSKSGMWFPSGTGLGFSTNRTLRMSILTDGKIGIGMTPTELLDVNGNARALKILTPEVKTDTVTPTDLTVTCGTDKTLVLSESVWDDIQFQISSGRVSQANFPDWDTFTTNTSEYKFAVNDYIDLAANELSHWWKQGTDVYPHLHITTDGANTSGSSQYVKFKVYFAYADASEVWTETDFDIEKEIPTGTADMTHLLANGVALALTNNLIGTQVKIRVKRIAATTGTEYPNHIFITQVGLHAEKDTMGSRQIGVK